MICISQFLTLLQNIVNDLDLKEEEKIKQLIEIKTTVEEYIALCQDKIQNRESRDKNVKFNRV